MPEEKLGIKETKEGLVGVNEISIFLITRFRDGVQFADFTAFWDKLTKDEEFKKVLQDAYDKWQDIPKELRDLDLSEGLSLASLQIAFIPRIVEAFNSLQTPVEPAPVPAVAPVEEAKEEEKPE